MSGKLTAFLAGGAIGALMALLYAPRPGEETRALVADKANEAWGQAREYGSQAQARGQEIYDNMSAQGKVAYQTASANASQAFTTASTNVQQAYNTASSGAKEAFGAAQARVSGLRDGSKSDSDVRNDELREKIEAARERIAAQVAKNAEESMGNAPVDVPAEAEEAAEAVVEAVEDTAAEAVEAVAEAAEEAEQAAPAE